MGESDDVDGDGEVLYMMVMDHCKARVVVMTTMMMDSENGNAAADDDGESVGR